MRRLSLFATLLTLLALRPCLGQDVRREISFPDLPGFQTLKCDLHSHTVFSDGSVWPATRIREAWRTGLDATAITDHIEYQPHKDDVSTDYSRPFDLAAGIARERGVLFPRGAEITRDTPPGHFNALFLKEIQPLKTDDLLEAIGLANQQGAFVFWNHHDWKGAEKGRWLDVHTQLYEKKWLHGMEVANGSDYYPTAHRWCLDKKLTMVGNSDIHDPDLHLSSAPDDHRTLTLVFVKQRTVEGLKEALMEGRTVVWLGKQLVGRAEWLVPLFEASVRVTARVQAKDAVVCEVANRSDCEFRLSKPGIEPIVLPPRGAVMVRVSGKAPLEAEYQVGNLLSGPNVGTAVKLRVAAVQANK